MTYNKVLKKYREPAFLEERDKGDRFKLLMQRFLLTDATYSNKFKNDYQTDRYYKNIAYAKN